MFYFTYIYILYKSILYHILICRIRVHSSCVLITQLTHQSAANQRGNESKSSQFIRINPATRKCWQEGKVELPAIKLTTNIDSLYYTTRVCTTSYVTSCILIVLVTHTHKLIPVLLLLKVTRSSVFTKEVITTGRIGRPVQAGGEESSCGFDTFTCSTSLPTVIYHL